MTHMVTTRSLGGCRGVLLTGKNPRRLLHDTNSTLKTEVDASALHFRVTATLRLEVT